jgi:hypothetical protein
MYHILVRRFRIALLLLTAVAFIAATTYSSDQVIIERKASDGEIVWVEIVRPIPGAACTALFLYKGDEQVLSVTEYFARSPEELLGAFYFPTLGIYATITVDLEGYDEEYPQFEVECVVGRDTGEYELLPRQMTFLDKPFADQSFYLELSNSALVSETKEEINEYLDSLGLGDRLNVLGLPFAVFLKVCEYPLSLGETRHIVFSYFDMLTVVLPSEVYSSAASEFGSLAISTAIGLWGWLGGLFAGAADIVAHHPEWLPTGGGTKPGIPFGAKVDPLNPNVWDYGAYVIPKHQPWNKIWK